MAWDPNEKGSWAWFTKEASNHGGVESYIDDIEQNAKAEAHDEDMKLLPVIIGASLIVGGLCKTAYDKVKEHISDKKRLKQKSEVAKNVLVNSVNMNEPEKKDNETEEEL